MEEHIKMTSEAGVVWYYFRIWEHGKCYFYGARHGKTQGEGMIVDDNPDSFQITVYEEDLDVKRNHVSDFPRSFLSGKQRKYETWESIS